MKVLLEQIITPVTSTDEEMFDIARARIKKTRALTLSGDMYVYKRSVDARHKDSIKLVNTVCADVTVLNGKSNDDLSKFNIKILSNEQIEFEYHGEKPINPPIVVGFGP